MKPLSPPLIFTSRRSRKKEILGKLSDLLILSILYYKEIGGSVEKILQEMAGGLLPEKLFNEEFWPLGPCPFQKNVMFSENQNLGCLLN